MNCERCREMLPDHVGDELDPQSAEELRKHLANCAACRRELDFLEETRAALKLAWPDEAIPENLTFDRPGRASAHPGPAVRWWQAPRAAWLSLAAAACLVFCLGTLAFLHARIQVGEGGFSLSFGPELPAPVIRHPAPPPQPPAESEVTFRRVLNQKIGQLERSNDRLREALARIQSQWEEQRSLDLHQVNGDLNYLEKLQEVVRQKTARNEVLISSVADHYIRTGLADTVPSMDRE